MLQGTSAFQACSFSASPPWCKHRFPPDGTDHPNLIVTPLCLLILSRGPHGGPGSLKKSCVSLVGALLPWELEFLDQEN